MWKRMALYLDKYPARVSGYLSAIVLNASKMWKDLPMSLLIPAAMLLIGMGEASQRAEDRKTLKALYTENDPHKPDDTIIAEMFKDMHDGGKK
jgi:hypothetical protein